MNDIKTEIMNSISRNSFEEFTDVPEYHATSVKETISDVINLFNGTNIESDNSNQLCRSIAIALDLSSRTTSVFFDVPQILKIKFKKITVKFDASCQPMETTLSLSDLRNFSVNLYQTAISLGDVNITVKNSWLNKMSESISMSDYFRFCIILLIRYRFNLDFSPLLNREGPSKINLRESNLSHIDLSLAILSEIDLSGSPMVGTKLTGADLRRTDLSRADLRKADLRFAKLEGVILEGANLQEVNLNDSCLDNVNMSEANFSHASLHSANLRWANLSGADLSNADLRMADLSMANLTGANLSGAKLCGANLFGANLSRSNLSETDLSQAYLSEADLSMARIIQANLVGVVLVGANLSNILHDNLLLQMPNWTEAKLDLYLNHLNNPDSGSLLTMIDGIDERFADVKIRMARELLDSLTNVDLSSVALPLLDILSKPTFKDDNIITARLKNICHDSYLSENSPLILPPLTEPVLEHLLDNFRSQADWCFTHNSVFIQAIAQGIKASNLIKELTIMLYCIYLGHEKIKHFVELDEFGDYGTYKPAWDDDLSANYIMFSIKPDSPVMLLSHSTLEGLLDPHPLQPVWDKVYLYQPKKNPQTREIVWVNVLAGVYPLEKLYCHDFNLFQSSYRMAENSTSFHKLLLILKLGEMHSKFISAAKSKGSRFKLIGEVAQKRLAEIFKPKLFFSENLQDSCLQLSHYGEIIQLYGLYSAGSMKIASTLFSLAAIFTKYSSSTFFGSEAESPQIIRVYAYALMKQAYVIDASIFQAKIIGDQFTVFENRLLGLNNAFDCSALLSDDMIKFARKRFPDVLAGILPMAWS